MVLPLFKGKMDALKTAAFVAKVASFATVTRLTPEETAEAVAFAMADDSPADKWMQNLRLSNAAAAGNWTLLSPMLVTRFSPRLTPSEKASLVEGLKQSKDEDVHAFVDRCHSVQFLMERDIPDDQKQGANRANYEANHDAGVLEKFLRGLRTADNLKQAVNSAPQCDTLAQYMDAATRIEKNSAKASAAAAAVVAAMEAEMTGNGVNDEFAPNADDSPEVAAIKVKFAKYRANGNNRNRSNNRSQSGSQGGQQRTGTTGDTPRKCWNCGKEGHLRHECTNPKVEGAAPNRNSNNRRRNGGGGGDRGGATTTSNTKDAAILEMLGRQYLQEQGVQFPGNQTQTGGAPPAQYPGF